MIGTLRILADSDDSIVKGLVFVAALIFWGISALAKTVKKASTEQKDRLRKVREEIERSQQGAGQQAPQQRQTSPQQQISRQRQISPQRQMSQQRRALQQPTRPPVQLAPEIARRVPPPVTTFRPAAQRKMIRRPAALKRAATNYNALTMKKTPAPPPLPAAKVMPTVQFQAESAPPPPMSTSRKSTGVAAAAITQWLNPATLRRQYILTEIFQPPIALRGGHAVSQHAGHAPQATALNG